jgi:uncharacterized protein (TIGR03435 family)
MGFARGSGTRFSMHGATMLTLIQFAWSFSADKILGGPSWLEVDHYDIDASVPAGTPMETQRLMLQSLLQDRFKLVLRKENRPLDTYAITVTKTNRMKPGDKSGDTGCHIVNQNSGGPNGGQILIGGAVALGGGRGPITLGPNGLIQYACNNVSMDSFATTVSGMLGAGSLGNNPTLNKTGLEGDWSFDLKWNIGVLGLAAENGEQISIFDAFEKQLGLKLEKTQVPTPVMVVESVLETPTPNPPGVAEALPPISSPTSFEVADVKPSAPGGRGGRASNNNGRYTAENMTLGFLLGQAMSDGVGPLLNNDRIVNQPNWVNDVHFDINAKIAAGDDATVVTIGPLLRSLLVERFGLKYHTEERPVSAYTLVAVKPKLKKADPTARTHCVNGNNPPGSPPGTQSMTCQNVTMDQFAEQLRGRGQGISWLVLNATGLEGSWDFTITYSNRAILAAVGRGGDAPLPPGGIAEASDPSGTLTLFEAIEKQLGLKLEPGKRPMMVTVIDHLNQTPTDN